MKSSKCDKLGLCLLSEPSGSSAAGCACKERAGYNGRQGRLWGWGGSCGAELHSLSPAWEDRWLVLLFNSSSRLYVRPVGERVRCEKRGQWARIGWDQDQMPAEQWGFWKKCGRKRGACFVLPPHCRLEWGSSDLMKCIPKRGRQPGLGDKGTCQKGACGAGVGGGAIHWWIAPNNAVLVLDEKNHQYIPVRINAIQQVLLNVCPRIVLPPLSQGGGRKETSRGMHSSGVEM